MDQASLDRIRRKVEAGDRLTEPELNVLRGAARSQPGPTLRLAVAHALINVEENRSALTLLERLVGDFPRDLQAWLGLARALLALDRFGEAERALNAALALSPGDPEALKALALVAMRRGEFARARTWISDVLRRDPFDDEAKLIRAELESSDPAPDAGSNPPNPPDPDGASCVSVALRPEFTRTLLRMLKARGAQATARGGRLLLRPPGGEVARVDLASLYAGYLASGGAVEAEVRRIVDGLVEASSLPESAEVLLAKVLPVLRADAFAAQARGALHREGPAGLSIYYVLEDPELVRYVPSGTLSAKGLTLEQVDRAALEGLAGRSAPIQRLDLDGVVAVCGGDGHDAARLLLTPVREQIARELGPPPWRVDLGRREAAILCGADDVQACAALEALPASSDGLAGSFIIDPEGMLRRVDDAR